MNLQTGKRWKNSGLSATEFAAELGVRGMSRSLLI
jgi:hypothetical protein